MQAEHIARALVRRGILSESIAQNALTRQKIYGGCIDSMLFELGVVEEAALLAQLAEIVGIPLAHHQVIETLAPLDPPPFPLALAERMGAVPLAYLDDALHLALLTEHRHEVMCDWAASKRILVEPFLVSEPRFRILLHRVYRAPLAPRMLSLVARLLGSDMARQTTQNPKPVSQVPMDPIDTWLSTARLGDPQARKQAFSVLAKNLADPRVGAYLRSLYRKAKGTDLRVAQAAMSALVELRDKMSVPVLIPLLIHPQNDVAQAAHEALRLLTLEDLGMRPRLWQAWWDAMGGRDRSEWLYQGMAHREPEIRLLASEEVYALCGEYFGYHFDLPEREREEARKRFLAYFRRQYGK